MPTEAGIAVPGCGVIHMSEVKSTLTKLSDDLKFPFNLNDFIVGSAGKSEYSGDIDVVIDPAWYDGSIENFHKDLKSVFGATDIARHGAMLHIKYPIENYNNTYNEKLTRNGFVQVDFMFGDFEWLQFYYYSHGNQSEYKGFHRNIAITAITAITSVVHTKDIDDYGRPVSLEKWKWGSNGLIKVIRSSRQRSDGSWLKGQTDTVIAGPHCDKHFISTTLFPVDGTPDDLNSLETIILAIKRNYPISMQADIFKKIARNFNENNDAMYFSYPPEIEEYFSTDDK